MTKLQDIYTLFNELRFHSGAIWIENETIKLSTPKILQTQKIKDSISNNRNEIISLLKKNQILSKEIFFNKVILTDDITTHYPLSPAQERLWFIEQLEEGSNAFHIPDVYEIKGVVDKDIIKNALQEIVFRHEILRSTIEHVDNIGHGIQKVHTDPLPIEEVIVSGVKEYEALLKEDINRPFNLSKEYPIRVKFYIIKSPESNSTNRTFLLINKHHIASDGWSEDIFQKEFFAIVNAYIKNDTSFKLPAIELQYKNYAIWQKAYLRGEILEKQLSYWKKKLFGYQTLEFPTDYARPDKVNYKGGQVEFKFNKQTSQKLRELTLQNGVTLQSVLLSSVSILLNKYTGNDDIVVGSPIANRHHRQTENLIGFFVNNQVNRILLKSSQSFIELIQEVHQDQIEAQLNQDLPFEKLVNELRIQPERSSHPIYRILFSVVNFAQNNESNQDQNQYFEPCNTDDFYEVEKLDFSIYVANIESEELSGVINYATSLFRKETIELLVSRFTNLLIKLTENPNKRYSEINLLNAEEFEQIVYKWKLKEAPPLEDKTLVDLFEEQVAKTPDDIAVVFAEEKLTYKQLDEQSGKLANYFNENYDIQANDLIGIMLDRSDKMIVAMLGILKVGAAYLFIEPEYPAVRKEYIIEDASPKIIITQTDYIFDLEFYKGNLFAIDIQLNSIDTAIQQLKGIPKPGDLAYVNYTSGTTGKPKGVMVEHKSVVNLVYNQVNCFGIDFGDKVLQFASCVFDASVSEIFTAISTGAQLLIVPNEIKQDANLLCNYIEKYNVGIATLPPVLLGTMSYRKFPFLKTLIVAGETCSSEQMFKWSRGRKLINAYGPTEGTVCATMHQYMEGDLNTNIGKPLTNTSVYILDPNHNPVPIGICGELYIGGANLAQGYLNNPSLTEERFILNPFATEFDKTKNYTRLYKTGDLARWLTDGNIEYLGRNDDQVKIRGYRIEVGEIEHALRQIVGIKQACVFAKERETEGIVSKYLVGYYVNETDEEKLYSSTFLLEELSKMLPDYMVPTVLVPMKSFPLTINGKIDKHAFPDPDFKLLTENYIPPITETEILACKIWEEVLGIERVGITDNFFRIGGNSILAIQVSHLMSTSLRRDIKVADIFKLKTIVDLFENIKSTNTELENIEKEF